MTKNNFFSRSIKKPIVHFASTLLVLFSCHFVSGQTLIADYPFNGTLDNRLGINSEAYFGNVTSAVATLSATGYV